MEKLESIINYASYIILVISLLATALNVIISLIKGKTIKKSKNNIDELEEELEDTKSELESSETMFEIINKILPQAIELAESEQVSGTTKKIIALAKVIQECANNGYDYSQFSNIVEEALEDLIHFSKEVNFLK